MVRMIINCLLKTILVGNQLGGTSVSSNQVDRIVQVGHVQSVPAFLGETAAVIESWFFSSGAVFSKVKQVTVDLESELERLIGEAGGVL